MFLSEFVCDCGKLDHIVVGGYLKGLDSCVDFCRPTMVIEFEFFLVHYICNVEREMNN